MSHRLHILICTLILGVAASAANGAGTTKIKKCQDDQGKWHYGDSAAAECAHSKITVMSKEGVTKKEIAAPPTEAELKARQTQEAEVEEANRRAEEQKKKDQLLLSTYAVEDDIVFVRDRKLAQVESQIKALNGTLESLNKVLARLEKQAADEQKGGQLSDETAKHLESTKHQIANREAEIAEKRREQGLIKQEAETELTRYRELKGAAKPVAPAINKKP